MPEDKTRSMIEVINKLCAFAILLMFGAASVAVSGETSALAPVRRLQVAGRFTDDAGNVSQNLSGVACQPEAAGKRVCIVIDDQSRSAQVAFLEDGTLTPGRRIRLIDEASMASIVGSAPTATHCPDNVARFKDLDGEGVSYAAPYFYVVGSHGCSRKSGKFAISSFVTVRFRLDSSGELLARDGSPGADASAPDSSVEATYRLSDALLAADVVGSAFGAALKGPDKSKDGLNVEGVAVIGDVLYAGARAPSVDGKAYVVGAKIRDLFAPGFNRISLQLVVLTLGLGQNTGVRDLASLSGGRLLILAGPTRDDPDTHYSLFVAEPPFSSEVKTRQIARLEDVFAPGPDGKRAKAEAVLPLEQASGDLKTLILFDGLPNGGPVEYQTPIPED